MHPIAWNLAFTLEFTLTQKKKQNRTKLLGQVTSSYGISIFHLKNEECEVDELLSSFYLQVSMNL